MSRPFKLISGAFLCLLFMNYGNANAQSSEKINPAITEVYGSYVPKITPQQMIWLNGQIERSEVRKMERNANEALPLLSSVPLMTKFVSNLQKDEFKEPLKINPLKYMINFMKAEDQIFRIDGTDYVLVVKAKK